MKKGTIYKRGDAAPQQMVERFVWTGEFREPRKGEFYISGAIAEVYEAPNDLSYRYHIARRIRP